MKGLGRFFPTVLAAGACLLVGLSMSAHASDVKLQSAAIEKIVIDYIEQHMPWPRGSVRIEFMSRIHDVMLEGDEINCRVESGRNEDYIGHASFGVRFYNGGYFLREQPVRVRIEVLRNFVVAGRYLSRGTTLGPGDVTTVSRWVDRTIRDVLTHPDEVIGKVLRTSVRKNFEIKDNMLRNPLLVKTGELVRIVLMKGALHMATIGISEQNGAIGDIIKVKNASSNKSVYARVVDESVVRVDFR